MDRRTPPSGMRKRPNEDSSGERPKKSQFALVKVEEDSMYIESTYLFRILLPNSKTLELKITELPREMPIEEFLGLVKKEYQRSEIKAGRRINWDYREMHFTDAREKKIRLKLNFQDFTPMNWHFLWLHDGSAEPETYEDMWDLTPDTDLLKELPDDYTFVTALADLIDNSLQAVCTLRNGARRLISVKLEDNNLSIFDTGPGMDGTDGNLAKWGKMGASNHRSQRPKGLGGKPPYLKPYFGMFGYGGPVATMHLGRSAILSSKTRSCSKVYVLHLEKEALINSSRREKKWRTKGGMRDASQEEEGKTPHGSFTKVEIFDLRMRPLDIKLLQCKLKDIYFPYIQCDGMSGRTLTPVEFQVNGVDLAEIQGGEVATTNMNSGNGREFILQLHLTPGHDTSSGTSQRSNVAVEANARLKCVYFPVKKGKEGIDIILEKLEEDGYGIRESYEGFSRVSIRRLGRLLPDARWAWLPFMEPKKRIGERAQILKRCCLRVKCFIETDSGFNPTPSKTDLAQHHPYTSMLKNFGNMVVDCNNDVQIEIERDGKKLNLSQLEKQYHDWILDMHENFDDEVDNGLDTPVYIVPTKDKKKLGISSYDVVRVHKEINRKGSLWRAGQKIKILKGACTGCHKNNIFAILEYIVLEGLQGEACGEARLICRPITVPEDRGCCVSADDIEIRDSISIPLSVIDSEMCLAMDDVEWKQKKEFFDQKRPSSIELLSRKCCQQLDIEGGLLKDVVKAGDTPENLVAVIRPKAFIPASHSKLDQKFIVKENLKMSLEVSFRAGDKNVNAEHVYSKILEPSICQGIQGLYIFPLRLSNISIFKKAGIYTLSFFLNNSKDVEFKKDVQIRASAELLSWKICNLDNTPLRVRMGSLIPCINVSCNDQYGNEVPFTSVPNVTVKLRSRDTVLAPVWKMKVDLTADKSIMTIKDIFVKCSQLDKIRPDYEAMLIISTPDESVSVDYACQVLPGIPAKISLRPQGIKRNLLPGQILDEIVLEVFDSLGNHARKDEPISLSVDGFSFLDGAAIRKVDGNGFVDLSNILKVSKGYGEDVILSVNSKENTIFKLDFHTETRKLSTTSKVFKNCEAGSWLKDIVFEVIDPKGALDKTIDDDEKKGKHHTLKITSESFELDDSVSYSFRLGRCSVRAIPLPQTEGVFLLKAAHSLYPELTLNIEVHVKKTRTEDLDDVGSFEDLDNIESLLQARHRDLMIIPRSTPSNAREMLHESSTPLSRNGKALLFIGLPYPKTPKQEPPTDENYTGCSLDSLQDPTNDSTNSGSEIGEGERTLEMLKLRRLIRISDSIASQDSLSEESIRKQIIENRIGSAAGTICLSFEQLPFERRPDDILGIVALLGSVETSKLSRMLAKYLGEEQMLTIVCKEFASAESLESHILHNVATRFGKSITGGYNALCLEDVRPFSVEPSGDPHEQLPLPIPSLDGNTPRGFMGYAVNMITVEESHSCWRTKSGYNLRETLFYRLFGDVQIYEDKECMRMAQSCIQGGAISLDGGIIRGNGLVSLGNWEPEICFPVRNNNLLSQRSSQAAPS